MKDGEVLVNELSGGKLRLIWRDRAGLARNYESNIRGITLSEGSLDCKWRILLSDMTFLTRNNSSCPRTFSTSRNAALAAEKYMEHIGVL